MFAVFTSDGDDYIRIGALTNNEADAIKMVEECHSGGESSVSCCYSYQNRYVFYSEIIGYPFFIKCYDSLDKVNPYGEIKLNLSDFN